jgi:predicted glycogen debranching enzyme
MNWAYSELFQNYSREQVCHYWTQAEQLSRHKGPLLNYAETHDNNRLAATSDVFARMRTALCALLSDSGAFGITNGVEWYADEKIDVHRACALRWDSEDNMVSFIARINRILAYHPAMYPQTDIAFIHTSSDNSIAVLRTPFEKRYALCILVNLDHSAAQHVTWPADAFSPADTCHDLLATHEALPAVRSQEDAFRCELAPGQVCCLTNTAVSLPDTASMTVAGGNDVIPRYEWQRCRAKACEIIRFFRPGSRPTSHTPEESAAHLIRDPLGYVRLQAGTVRYTPVVQWRYPQDARRMVPVPAGHVLYIEAPSHFRAYFEHQGRILTQETSLCTQAGTSFLLMVPPDVSAYGNEITLHCIVFEPKATKRIRAYVHICARTSVPTVRRRWDRTLLDRDHSLHAVCTNDIAAMAQVRAAWSTIHSKYDAFLAANLHKSAPADRTIMWTRCRIWLSYRGYSFSLDASCQQTFSVLDTGAQWEFHVPCGNGLYVAVHIRLTLDKHHNRGILCIQRSSAQGHDDMLSDDIPVQLIVRPDIDDRGFHEVTKAFAGSEETWPRAISAQTTGFRFSPSGTHSLCMEMPHARFVREDEWLYMVSFPQDEERGLDECGDFYSPGWFSLFVKGETCHYLQATVLTAEEPPLPTWIDAAATRTAVEVPAASVPEMLTGAVRAFLVRRDQGTTVIAGYPWFLDWGRDTLISLRGIVAAGYVEEARSIIFTFCRYEDHGTLPNMIRGNDASNRDTSDAPLWLFAACTQLMQTDIHGDVLAHDVGGRTVLEVLVSIARNYIQGTSNGIHMDAHSALVYSPPHFTWMDTNFPAATPREGYPIEIQALWHCALAFLSRHDASQRDRWAGLRDRVAASIARYFPVHAHMRYCADVLRASHGMSPEEATPDDALRPNQLLAVTLGAVSDPDLRADMVTACAELVVPGAIRSLADRKVSQPLHVMHEGRELLDPHHPYRGKYTGNEDTQRKPAYHNGTAWTWLFPVYCEALLLAYGRESLAAVRSLLSSAHYLLNSGCVGHLPEITDGDAPHHQKGCGAQAWGITELYRVIDRLGP